MNTMSSSPESSNPLRALPPSPASDAPAPPPACPPATKPRPPAMSPERKRALLADRHTIQAILKVARARKVPEQERHDVVQTTLCFAWKARLPDSEPDARRIVNAIAMRHSCKLMGQRVAEESYREEADEATGESATKASTAPPEFTERAGIQALVKKAEAKFPGAFPSFLRARTQRVTARQIAAERGVSEGHVRKEWSLIERFMRDHGAKLGLTFTVALVLLVFGSMRGWGTRPLDPNDVRRYELTRVHAPPLTVAELRQRATKDFEQGAWLACIHDADAVLVLDPDGDNERMLDVLARSERNVLTGDHEGDDGERGGGQFNVKEPLRFQQH